MRNKSFVLALVIWGSCQKPQTVRVTETGTVTETETGTEVDAEDTEVDRSEPLSETEKSMITAGLVDVRSLNPDISIELRYSDTNNFLHTNIYGTVHGAYLEKNCADKLALAQRLLGTEYHGYSLLVWDAARPVRCQQTMWDAVDFPFEERVKYVSNPKNRSLHNFGCAVDVTILDSSGIELDMGTGFDDFDTLAQPEYETRCLLSGSLSNLQYQNRILLRRIMRRAGFSQLPREWWHFNCCRREYAVEHYKLVE
ncbi:MAG: peptidase M15 [Bacteroidetes bacterium]|nr:peptidase M15 [Bacteroidota bacterium]